MTVKRASQKQDLGTLAAGIIAAEEESPAALADEALTVIPGLSDTGADGPSLRSILARWGGGPLAVLFALNVVDELDRIALITLAPDIRDAFGLSDAAIGAINGIGAVIIVTMAIPFAVLGDRRSFRTKLAGIAALTWAGVVFATGLARNTAQLVLTRMLSGIGKASVDPIHSSLLADYYPAEARARVYGVHQSANAAAVIFGPLLAGGIAAVAGGTAGWRWAFVVLAIPSVIAGLAALRLREPKRGAHERRSLGAEEEKQSSDAPKIPLGTAVRRLNQIRTLRYLYVGIGMLGFGLIAGPTLLSLYFEEHWGVGELGRGAIFSIMGVGTTLGLVAGGIAGDRLFRRDPAWPVFLIGASIVLYTLVTAAAIWLPALWLVVAVLVVSLMGVGAATAPLRQIVAAVAPPQIRSLAFALLGIYIALYGGFAGGIIFGAISDASSPRVALSFLVIPGVIAGVLMAWGARYVRSDIALVVADVREAERAAERRTKAARNLLEVRNVDFSYGSVQVLFDISLDVPEGEIIALLGTNGAGKSTLLRLVTGLDHPTRGSIRFDGDDITYVEAEQLLGLGIAQMPGGKAVFPGLTVVENLKAGAFSFRKDTARITTEIDQVETWFPILRERRNQLASTLSGGEQQMLALGKAFLTRPRLLCIDELALGLAPQVVGSLLAIVREMHDRGTTVVIVEQSLNVACSIASTAVFLEKGHVRFTGPARELLERPDLARSVFLEGATR